MIELDLGDELVIEVKYQGQKYVIREPTVAEIDSFREVDKESATEKLNLFLTTLGFPADVLKTMGASKVRQLVDGIIQNLTKKN